MKNFYKVPKKQWKKWPELCRRVFNKVYADMASCHGIAMHPKTPPMPMKEWNTVAWNVAWIAADACLASLKKMSKE